MVESGNLIVTGSVSGPITVSDTLSGSGTFGPVTVEPGATVSPGASPGILTTGDLTFSPGSTLVMELEGTAPGSGYDQLVVSGIVNLGGATLQTSRNFVPANGTQFILIDNDGTDPIQGTFDGLDENEVLSIDGRLFQISYAGGTDSNDVVLTAIPTTLHWLGNVDSNWNIAGNWLENVTPIDGDSVVFDTSTAGFAYRFTAINYDAGLVLNQIMVHDDSNLGNFHSGRTTHRLDKWI